MKVSLVLCLAMLVIMLTLIPTSESAVSRRRPSGRAASLGAPRRGRARSSSKRSRKGKQPRRGRTGDAAAPPAEGEEGEGEAEFDGPTWCNPEDPMGAWLLFKGVKLNCVDNGIEEFGRYGGIPAEDEDVPAE